MVASIHKSISIIKILWFPLVLWDVLGSVLHVCTSKVRNPFNFSRRLVLMANIFSGNGELGSDILDKLLTKMLTTRQAVEEFHKGGVTVTLRNVQKILAKYRSGLIREKIVIVDRPPKVEDMRLTIAEVESSLIKKPEETVKPLWIIENALLDLERVKLDFGRGTREYMLSLKLQTDIASDLYKLAPKEDKIDVEAVLKSFDWLTEFVDLLHKEYNQLNIRGKYLEYIEEKRLLHATT